MNRLILVEFNTPLRAKHGHVSFVCVLSCDHHVLLIVEGSVRLDNSNQLSLKCNHYIDCASLTIVFHLMRYKSHVFPSMYSSQT